ncbi:MAG: hypothetical protein ACR2H4_09355 [Pyrinomonadaceae bacterium]
MLKIKITLLTILSIVLLSTFALPGSAQDDKDKKVKKTYTGTPFLWREPTDIESRNLLLGAGGEAMKPDLSPCYLRRTKDGRILH